MSTQPQIPPQDELPEYPYVGPFGGVQSEVPLDKVGRTGFAEVQNILFRKAGAQSLPAFEPLPSPDGNPIVGIADFFSVDGARHFIVWTSGNTMWTWDGSLWTQITGSLTGTANQFMAWDVVGYKLYFSQQKDVVQQWDGITGGFSNAGSGAPIGKYLCELDFHLLVANTIESGNAAPNRIHWSGIGDGTDWTSFSSGQNDLFNGLGPINGLSRIYQAGYAFQQWGITQIIPTGIGLVPFQFVPMGSRAKGSILPYGVASFGETIACYVGKDDIYIFDGTESTGIGGKPIDGNRRLGARTRIFNDLNSVVLSNVTAFINTSNYGQDYESYWILIPGLNKAWIYHFDEQSWTQMYFNTGQLYGPVGIFNGIGGTPEIRELVGRIIDQTWTFDSIAATEPLDTMAISDANANSVSAFSPSMAGSFPTSGSLNPTDGWYIRSGSLTFDDPRHIHTIKKVRCVFIDLANITLTLKVTNEKGQSETHSFTFGSGSGLPVTQVIPFSISGVFLTWEMSGPQGVNFQLSEISPIYDTGGEVQNNR